MENFFIFPFSSSKFEDIACGLFELGAAMSSNFDDEKGKIKKFSMPSLGFNSDPSVTKQSL